MHPQGFLEGYRSSGIGKTLQGPFQMAPRSGVGTGASSQLPPAVSPLSQPGSTRFSVPREALRASPAAVPLEIGRQAFRLGQQLPGEVEKAKGNVDWLRRQALEKIRTMGEGRGAGLLGKALQFRGGR